MSQDSRRPRRLGIIAAPGWFDPTMREFMERHPGDLEVTQTILTPPGFDYSFESIENSEPALESAARVLAEAGSELIAQVGPAFAYQVGRSPSNARGLSRRLSAACGVDVVLNGVAVLDALDDLGCRRVAVACPYYNPQWKQKFLGFLDVAGYSVESAQTFVEQGIFASQADVDARRWEFSDAEILASIRRTRAAAAHAEAIIVTGSGVRTLRWAEELQRELGIPLLSADFVLYKDVTRRLELAPATG